MGLLFWKLLLNASLNVLFCKWLPFLVLLSRLSLGQIHNLSGLTFESNLSLTYSLCEGKIKLGSRKEIQFVFVYILLIKKKCLLLIKIFSILTNVQIFKSCILPIVIFPCIFSKMKRAWLLSFADSAPNIPTSHSLRKP